VTAKATRSLAFPTDYHSSSAFCNINDLDDLVPTDSIFTIIALHACKEGTPAVTIEENGLHSIDSCSP